MTTPRSHFIILVKAGVHPNIPPTPSWIPAFAGMTAGTALTFWQAHYFDCYLASRSIIAPQPYSSFRRRPESSGLNNPFPQSGNDSPISVHQPGKNKRQSNTPVPPSWIPAFAGMTAGVTSPSRPALDSSTTRPCPACCRQAGVTNEKRRQRKQQAVKNPAFEYWPESRAVSSIRSRPVAPG